MIVKRAVLAGDFGDGVREYGAAAICEGCVGGGVFQQRDFVGAERERKIGVELRDDAETARSVDDVFRADDFGDLEGDSVE